MPAPDSIARRVIAHLQATLPPDILAPLYFDTVTTNAKHPTVVVIANPSVPELRYGYTDLTIRNMTLQMAVLWPAGVAREYDKLERTIEAVIDIIATLHGTAIIGDVVLQSVIDSSSTSIQRDPDTDTYIAEFEAQIQFTRPAR